MLERGHSTLPSPLILINPRTLRGRKGHLSFVVRNSSHEMTSGGLVFFIVSHAMWGYIISSIKHVCVVIFLFILT